MQGMPMKAATEEYPPVMTSREVMSYLRIGRTTFDKLVAQRELRGFKVGRDHRFYRAEIEDWAMNGGTSEGGTKAAGKGVSR